MITRLTVRNFLSFKELDLDFTGYSNKLVLIQGNIIDEKRATSNGAGKSAISEAIVWGLFGNTIRDLKSVSDVVNKYQNKNCLVCIEFYDSGQKYLIERYRDDDEHKNNVYFYQVTDDNLNDLRGASNKDTDKKIVDIFGLDFSSFVNSHIFTGSVNRFTTATDQERKKILQSIINVDWIDESLLKVKKELSFQFEQMDSWDKEIFRNETLVEKLKSERTILNEKYNELLNIHKLNVKEKNKKLDKIRQNINSGKKRLYKLEAAKEKYVKKIGRRRKIIRLMEKAIYDKGRIKTVLALKESEYNRLVKSNSSVKKLEGGKCDKCMQDVNADYVKKYSGSVIERCDVLSVSIKKYKVRVNSYQDKIDDFKDDMDKYDKLESKMEYFNLEIINLKDEISKLRNKLLVIKNEVKFSRKELIDVRISLKKIDKDMEGYKLTIKYCNEKKNKVKKYCSYLEILEKVFGKDGLRVHIFQSLVPVFNSKTNYYLSMLSDDITVKFDVRTELNSGKVVEKFNVHVMKTKGSNSYGGMSTGQKRKVDVAIVPALRLLYANSGKDKGLVVYDEIFDSIDSMGIESIIDMLKSEQGTRFVITHKDDLSNYFDDVITVNNLEGISYV